MGGRADLLIQSQPHKNREDLSMSDGPPDDLEYSPLSVLSSSHALESFIIINARLIEIILKH